MTTPPVSEDRPIRLVFMCLSWTGYLDGALKALLDRYGAEAMIVQDRPDPLAPYDVHLLPAAQHCEHAYYDEGYEALAGKLQEFDPNVIITWSWGHPHYRRLCRDWRNRAVRLLITDAQWRGTLKQLGGILVSPILVHPTTDYVFVPGDRQARFMRFLGFGRERIIWPCLTGDTALFEPVAERPLHERKAFLVVARLHPRKGIDVLLEAYRRYRATTDAPWPLIMCGTGPLAERVQAEPGVEAVGFVQPGDLPQQFSRAACFVLPSMYEPYAVAAHEAVIAGLGLICSQAVGAGDNFVDLAGDNGAVVPTGDAAALAQALEDVARRSDDELETMRRRSIELAHRITPEIWADAVAGAVTDFEATAARRGRPASSRRD